MIRLTGLAAGCTPYSPSDGHSQSPAGHHARTEQPDAERAAVKQGGIVAVDDPDPPGFGSLKKSRGFYHQIAFALPFGLASTHAGVGSTARPSHCRERLTSGARSRASAVPSFSGPLHHPGPAFQPARMRCLMSVPSFRMAPRGAGSSFWASRMSARRTDEGASRSGASATRSDCGESIERSRRSSSDAGTCLSPSKGQWLERVVQGTAATTPCPATSRRSRCSTTRSSCTGTGRFGVAASAPAWTGKRWTALRLARYRRPGSCIPGPTCDSTPKPKRGARCVSWKRELLDDLGQRDEGRRL